MSDDAPHYPPPAPGDLPEQPDDPRARKRLAAEVFWSAFEIPFEYDTAIKGRLSGLTRGSDGTGTASNTKVHLFVEESFEAGQLSRDAAEYLCSPGVTPPFEFTAHRHVDDHGEEYVPAVSCKKCLRYMERWFTDSDTSDADTATGDDA